MVRAVRVFPFVFLTYSHHTCFMRKSLIPLLSLLLATACRVNQPAQPPLSPAVFTPDGFAIIFTVAHGKDCFLYEADIASGAMHRLTQATSGCESDPAFSPDGRQLAFMHAPRNGVRAALMLAKPDGTSSRMLVPGEEDNLQPVFVPHSNQILFLRSGAFEHYSPLVDNHRHKFDLFSADLAGGGVTALTQQKFYDCSGISVSADGKQIIMSVSTYPEGDQFLILPIGEPGAPTQRLQPMVPNAPGGSPVVYNALWLPDGRSVIFAAATRPPEGNFNYNVYRLDIASGSIEQLSHLTGLLDGLSVSTDGKKAVLLRQGVYSVLDLSTQQLTPVRLQKPT
jgi:Tol biopolymer transport system component